MPRTVFLLDTNVLSDSSKPEPDPTLQAWMRSQKRIAIPFPMIVEFQQASPVFASTVRIQNNWLVLNWRLPVGSVVNRLFRTTRLSPSRNSRLRVPVRNPATHAGH